MVLFLSENQTHLTFAAAFLGGYFFCPLDPNSRPNVNAHPNVGARLTGLIFPFGSSQLQKNSVIVIPSEARDLLFLRLFQQPHSNEVRSDFSSVL